MIYDLSVPYWDDSSFGRVATIGVGVGDHVWTDRIVLILSFEEAKAVVEVVCPVNGVVEGILVHENDVVVRGQVIMKIRLNDQPSV